MSNVCLATVDQRLNIDEAIKIGSTHSLLDIDVQDTYQKLKRASSCEESELVTN